MFLSFHNRTAKVGIWRKGKTDIQSFSMIKEKKTIFIQTLHVYSTTLLGLADSLKDKSRWEILRLGRTRWQWKIKNAVTFSICSWKSFPFVVHPTLQQHFHPWWWWQTVRGRKKKTFYHASTKTCRTYRVLKGAGRYITSFQPWGFSCFVENLILIQSLSY